MSDPMTFKQLLDKAAESIAIFSFGYVLVGIVFVMPPMIVAGIWTWIRSK